MTLFTNSCSTYPEELKSDELVLSTVPTFPSPHSDIVRELKEVCPKDKCHRLYDWLSKLMVFEKQLSLCKGTEIWLTKNVKEKL